MLLNFFFGADARASKLECFVTDKLFRPLVTFRTCYRHLSVSIWVRVPFHKRDCELFSKFLSLILRIPPKILDLAKRLVMNKH
jgi:hypothetical protein